MSEYTKPLPLYTKNSEPFWECTRKHELRLQRCAKCAKVFYPCSPVCPDCWSRDYQWVRLSGRGKISSWVVFHQLYYESFKDDLPYNVAQVDLEEGPRIVANVVECKNEELYMGMPVEVVFDDVTPEVTLPRFRPTRSAVTS